MSDVFVPGTWWTPERARDGAARMTAVYESPEMRMLMDTIARSMTAGEDPAKAAVALLGSEADRQSPPQPAPARPRTIDASDCMYRRARPDDVPRFAELLLSADLPPLFIEEWLGGFIAVEHEGRVTACGGVEMYGDCAVVRSVAVEEPTRGIGLGLRASELLLEDARLAGATDIYLFTMHAAGFWRKLGFVDVGVDDWRAPARATWQYRFFEDHPGAQGPVVSMWRRFATIDNKQQTTGEDGGRR